MTSESIPVRLSTRMIGEVGHNENRDPQNTGSDWTLYVVDPMCGAKDDGRLASLSKLPARDSPDTSSRHNSE